MEEITFPQIEEQPVMWGYHKEMHQAHKHKAIVDFNTGKLFSIVSKDYRLIRHEQAIDEIEEAIFKSCGIVLGFGAVAVFGFSLISAIKLGDVVHGFVTQNLELTLAIYREAGVAQETIDSIVGVREKIELILTRLLPAFIVTSMLFVSWISVLTARAVFGLKSIPYPDFGRLNRWKAPEILVWAAIFCGAAVFLPQLGVRWIGINGLLILATIYFFQGIAIVAFYFEKKRLPKLLRAVLYGMILLQPLIFIVIILFGFFDMWINFRRLNRASDQSSTDE